jgi:hypothetical protein
MTDSKKSDTIERISAVCFCIFGSYNLINFASTYYSITGIIMIAFAVLLFAEKMEKGFIIAGIAFVLCNGAYIIVDILWEEYTLDSLLYMVVAIAVLILVIYNFIPKLNSKAGKITKRLWFIPAIIMLICIFLYKYGVYDSSMSDEERLHTFQRLYPNYVVYLIKTFSILDVSPVVAFATFGLWLKMRVRHCSCVPCVEENENIELDSTPILEEDVDTANIDEVMVTQKPIVKSTLADMDKLEKYKELFDAGIISQEEFDIKKKQLLGF